MPKILLTSGTTWAGVETDGSNITVECIGGGGAGRTPTTKPKIAGGGGGAYAVKVVPYTSGATVTGIQIGQGGASDGASGTDTIWDTSVVIAKGGEGGGTSADGVGGAGGDAASCTPSAGAFSGGAGGDAGAANRGGAGGGGAAGPNGNGKEGGVGGSDLIPGGGAGGGGAGGGSSTGGEASTDAWPTGAGGTAQDGTAGGAGVSSAGQHGSAGSNGSGGGGGASIGSVPAGTPGGNGGAGGAGVEFDATHGAGGGGGGAGGCNQLGGVGGDGGSGGLYGGGGGSGGFGFITGGFGPGANGLIVITYAEPAPPPEDGFTITDTSVSPATPVTRDILQSWQIGLQLNERGTMRFGVKSMDGSYRPGIREVIDFRKFGIHFFAGHIHHTDEGGLGGYGVVPIVTQCGATDFKALPERRKVSMTLAAGTLKSQILELAEPLEVYGVTVDPAQVDGPSMPEMVLSNASVFEAFQKLSVGSGYAFEIDNDKVLRMYAPGSIDAPFNIEVGDGRVKGDVRVSPTTVDYGNHVTVKYTFAASQAFVYFVINNLPSDGTTFKVAGKEGVFKTTPTDPNHVQIGATINDTYNNFVGFVDPLDEVTGFNQTTRVDVYAAEPGASGNSIQVESNDGNGGADFGWAVDGVPVASHLYYGTDDALTGVVTAEDVPAQDGGANLYELVFEEPTVQNEEAAQQLADGYLARALVQPREIRYRTRLHGLRPGMKQHIEVPGRNVDADCLITQVDISPEGSALINYDVTAIEGLVIVASHQEKWRRMTWRAA